MSAGWSKEDLGKQCNGDDDEEQTKVDLDPVNNPSKRQVRKKKVEKQKLAVRTPRSEDWPKEREIDNLTKEGG